MRQSPAGYEPPNEEGCSRFGKNSIKDFIFAEPRFQETIGLFAQKFIALGEQKHFTLTTLTDMVWTVVSVMWAAINEGKAPALSNPDMHALQRKYDKLQKLFNECRSAFMKEITQVREQRRTHIWTRDMQEGFDELVPEEPVYYFVPEEAMEHKEFYKDAMEETVKLAMLKGRSLAQNQMGTLGEQLSALQKKNKELLDRLKAAEAENLKLQAMLESASHVKQDMSSSSPKADHSSHARPRREKPETTPEPQDTENDSEKENLRRRVAELQQQLQLAEKRAEKAEEQATNVQRELQQTRQAMDQLQKKLDAASKELAAKDETIAKLTAKLRKIEEEVQRLKDELAKELEKGKSAPAKSKPTLTKVAMPVSKELEDLEAKHAALLKKEAQLLERIEDLESRLARMKRDFEMEREKCRTLELEIERLKNELSSKVVESAPVVVEKSKNPKSNQRELELRKELEEANEMIKKLENIITTLRYKLREMEKLLRDKGVDVDAFNAAMDEVGITEMLQTHMKVFERLYDDAMQRIERREVLKQKVFDAQQSELVHVLHLMHHFPEQEEVSMLYTEFIRAIDGSLVGRQALTMSRSARRAWGAVPGRLDNATDEEVVHDEAQERGSHKGPILLPLMPQSIPSESPEMPIGLRSLSPRPQVLLPKRRPVEAPPEAENVDPSNGVAVIGNDLVSQKLDVSQRKCITTGPSRKQDAYPKQHSGAPSRQRTPSPIRTEAQPLLVSASGGHSEVSTSSRRPSTAGGAGKGFPDMHVSSKCRSNSPDSQAGSQTPVVSHDTDSRRTQARSCRTQASAAGRVLIHDERVQPILGEALGHGAGPTRSRPHTATSSQRVAVQTAQRRPQQQSLLSPAAGRPSTAGAPRIRETTAPPPSSLGGSKSLPQLVKRGGDTKSYWIPGAQALQTSTSPVSVQKKVEVWCSFPVDNRMMQPRATPPTQ